MFDCIGCPMGIYRPGVPWCSRCRINADQLYSPPKQVTLPVYKKYDLSNSAFLVICECQV